MNNKKIDFILLFRQILLIIGDIVIVNVAYLFSVAAENFAGLSEMMPMLLGRAIPVTASYILLYWLFGLYNSMWKYAGIYELMRCTLAGVVGSVLSIAVDKIGAYLGIFNMGNFKPLIYVTSMLIIIALTGAMRLMYRISRHAINDGKEFGRRKKIKRVMLVGAGDMGMIILKELMANGFRKGRAVVFVDDNVSKIGQKLCGVPVKGNCENIPQLVEQYRIDEIIYCIPSASAERQRQIIEIAMGTGCSLKKTPTIEEMQSGQAIGPKIKDVEISDLLPRPEVDLNIEQCRYLNGRTILVTGCGSIGSEICRQVAKHAPEKLILVDNYENNAFDVMMELNRIYNGSLSIFVRIGSVQDIGRMREIFEEFHPDIVFHAAAHKHVPLMEDSPCEAVKNNIFGTYNVAKIAMEFEVKKFIILSTDKAVNPANVMGATKRVTELIIQYFNRKTDKTDFAAVRFGNVLGSNGSVIPIFKKQIETGGPVTVTDPDVTRYFMTISEAAQLVVQAGSLSKGGEVFVLDMGEQIRILSLAEKIIKLSGYEPYKDIDIVFTGLRPGEKLYEELSLDEEIAGRKLTANNKIFVTPPIDFSDSELESALEKLKTADPENVRECLKEIVPNFTEVPD
ncbi:MAG: polysaccharide biosynthesis protein [Clostridiales bacterium]|nr:polysaccharide biosynthesis protein [Clostridiales bacterium]